MVNPGYLPDGTPLNRAGNAINHPERGLVLQESDWHEAVIDVRNISNTRNNSNNSNSNDNPEALIPQVVAGGMWP